MFSYTSFTSPPIPQVFDVASLNNSAQVQTIEHFPPVDSMGWLPPFVARISCNVHDRKYTLTLSYGNVSQEKVMSLCEIRWSGRPWRWYDIGLSLSDCINTL